MKLEHVFITRFSFRDTRVLATSHRPRFFGREDPLDPALLELRYKVFEMVCLPSLLAQTNQNFTWILIIDRDLGDAYRQRLIDLVGRKEHVYLHVFNPSDDLDRVEWIAPYLHDSPDYLVTSMLDSDDALGRGFVQSVRNHVDAKLSEEKLPAFEVFGSNLVVQWDIVTSRQAPLGWKASWHRHTDPLSCGFSLACAYPRFPFSILGLEHRFGPVYFDLSLTAPNPNVQRIRTGFGLEPGVAPDGMGPMWDFGADTGPSIVTNHFYNDQRGRVLERKRGLEVVSGPDSFPNVDLDWDAAHRYAADFSGSSPRFVARRLRQRFRALRRKSV